MYSYVLVKKKEQNGIKWNNRCHSLSRRLDAYDIGEKRSGRACCLRNCDTKICLQWVLRTLPRLSYLRISPADNNDAVDVIASRLRYLTPTAGGAPRNAYLWTQAWGGDPKHDGKSSWVGVACRGPLALHGDAHGDAVPKANNPRYRQSVVEDCLKNDRCNEGVTLCRGVHAIHHASIRGITEQRGCGISRVSQGVWLDYS